MSIPKILNYEIDSISSDLLIFDTSGFIVGRIFSEEMYSEIVRRYNSFEDLLAALKIARHNNWTSGCTDPQCRICERSRAEKEQIDLVIAAAEKAE